MFTITDKAASELKKILKGPDMPEKSAIRVFTRSGGCCSSHQLGIEIADMAKTDLQGMDVNGLKVLMDEQAKPVADNATIDFYDHEQNPGFRVLWQKQEDAGGCGCG